MLEVCHVKAPSYGDDLPDFCSICGKQSADYLVTPWDHIIIGECCKGEFVAFGHHARQVMLKCKEHVPSTAEMIARHQTMTVEGQ